MCFSYRKTPYLKLIKIRLPGYLISTVTWAYIGKVPTKNLQVVYDQFVPSHRAILNLLNGHGSMHIAVI